jgi:AraC-like DNA-binding protein
MTVFEAMVVMRYTWLSAAMRRLLQPHGLAKPWRMDPACAMLGRGAMNDTDSSSLPVRRIPLSLDDWQTAALTSRAPVQLAGLSPVVCKGMQDLLSLSDDLLLVRSDFNAPPPQALRWEIHNRNWLYLHCRAEGVSQDETPDGQMHHLGSGSFLLCTSQHRPLVREVLTDDWRAVTVAFRPSFALRDLQMSDRALPEELRQLRSGDPTADFSFASQLTADMKSAVRALLQPAVQAEARAVYLRAKVVELVCLALEELRHPDATANSSLKLSHRDLRSLEQARRVLDDCGEARSLEQLAKHVGLNRRKLALGFKHLFGVTVGDYDRQVRLELGRRLLESSTSASVGYAAAVAGYSDVGSFTKAFKARYGELPSAFKPAANARRLRK